LPCGTSFSSPAYIGNPVYVNDYFRISAYFNGEMRAADYFAYFCELLYFRIAMYVDDMLK